VIFVDTSAWFASSVAADQNHGDATALFASTDPRLFITSDYVLDECLTLLKARGEYLRALELGRRVLEERVCRLLWVEQQDVFKAWTLFEAYRRKEWSFTDCVSRALIERLRIQQVFTFDAHFREFGNVSVVP
jgi:predicted nucleic acid-binding protein